MYSTPGISQSSFSIGLVTRSSTSRAEAPGICTKMSTIGTTICGSSSLGSFHTAKAPSNIDPPISNGVNFEPIQAFANVPARPSCRSALTDDLDSGSVGETSRNWRNYSLSGVQTREHFNLAICLLADRDQAC